MAKALSRVGRVRDSEKFYYFMKKFAKVGVYGEIFHRYNSNGLPCVTRKSQNDNEGLLLHGIWDCYSVSKNSDFLEDMWFLVKEVVGLIRRYFKSGLVKTMSGVHEFNRLESGFDIWVNCACCRGFYDASRIAEVLGYEREKRVWEKVARKLERKIKRNFFDKKIGVYMKNLRLRGVPDASQVAPFYFGIDDSDDRLKKTLDYLGEHLWHKEVGGFRRFRKFDVVQDWHWYSGGSGAWVVFTIIIADLYKRVGDRKNYLKCLKWVERVASRSGGVLPEHVSTREEFDLWVKNEIEFNARLINGMKAALDLSEKFKGRDKRKLIYWATPLGWSHAEWVLLKVKK
jgi:GH15 family glucan-1,4-alpha-glucosidase